MMNEIATRKPDYIGMLRDLACEASQSSQRMSAIANVLVKITEHQGKLEKELDEVKKQNQVYEHRINNLDGTNITGTHRQRLNAMIRKYVHDKGILYNIGWGDFRRHFDTAYRTNIALRFENYKKSYAAKNLTLPEYLERAGLIEDALRVADKMINK